MHDLVNIIISIFGKLNFMLDFSIAVPYTSEYEQAHPNQTSSDSFNAGRRIVDAFYFSGGRREH